MSEHKHYSHLNMAGNELRNVALEQLSVPPAIGALYPDRGGQSTLDRGIYSSPDGQGTTRLLTGHDVDKRVRFGVPVACCF